LLDPIANIRFPEVPSRSSQENVLGNFKRPLETKFEKSEFSRAHLGPEGNVGSNPNEPGQEIDEEWAVGQYRMAQSIAEQLPN
jgi:hypothetical protein